MLNQDNKIYIYDRNGQYKSDYYREALSKTVKTGQINVTDKDAVNIVEDKKAILLVPFRMGDTGRSLSLAADEIKTLGFENVYALICDADKKMYEHYYGKKYFR